jgi:membrane fusion protein
MTSSTTRNGSQRTAPSQATRARRRAEFIANLRSASQVDVAAARPGARQAPPAPAPKAAAPRPAALPVRRDTFHAAPIAPPSALPDPPWARRAAPEEREAAPARPRPKASTQIVETTAKAAPAPAARRTAPAAPAAQPSGPAPSLFRAEALQHLLSSEEGRGLVRVSPPWTWALLWVVVSGLGVALAASFVGKVEVTGRGRGILLPASGVRALTSQMSGTVVAVEARSGDRVKAGATVLRIESATAQAQLLEAERELAAVRTRFSGVASEQDRHYAEQIQNLNARAARLGEQIASLRGTVGFHERRLEADRQLLAKGLVSELALGETREALAQAQRQLGGAETTLDQTRQELASLEARRQDELWQRQQLLASAQNKRDALAVVMQQSLLQAPGDGTVEALLVKPGEVVQSGQVVGKLVPVESPLHVVSFLAEKDRAFVKPGDAVELELDQLPHAEYGTVQARVARIGDDLASASEIRDALGDAQKLEAPSYRVELEITDARAADAAGVKLRTGALVNARYTLRRQKLITLVLSPLRRWFS